MYKILRESTSSKLEESINKISENYKPIGNIVIDSTKCFVILMEKK